MALIGRGYVFGDTLNNTLFSSGQLTGNFFTAPRQMKVSAVKWAVARHSSGDDHSHFRAAIYVGPVGGELALVPNGVGDDTHVDAGMVSWVESALSGGPGFAWIDFGDVFLLAVLLWGDTYCQVDIVTTEHGTVTDQVSADHYHAAADYATPPATLTPHTHSGDHWTLELQYEYTVAGVGRVGDVKRSKQAKIGPVAVANVAKVGDVSYA